ncbi:Zinc finger protein 358-like 4 [Homarus americanus]|uniref:Zinc finger protein 358-like 4 n=1 Tax=Homarus americanus TaxID=6706 RepID=A0A8J5MJW4_HOMAM|nr:Zinc finger protein 358-like 4 [Homarus americanus]
MFVVVRQVAGVDSAVAMASPRLDDCEDLMPKHLCLSCFNTAIDIQAFIDSGVNFQKTTISQLFPNAKVEEAYELPFATTYHQDSCMTTRALPEYMENTIEGEASGEKRPQDFLRCYTSFENSGDFTKRNYDQGHALTIERNVDNHRHIIESYQDSQGIFESSGVVNKPGVIITSKTTNTEPITSSHSLELSKKNSKSPLEGQILTSDQCDSVVTSAGKNVSSKQKMHGKKPPNCLSYGTNQKSRDSTDGANSNSDCPTERQGSVSSDDPAAGDNRLRKCPTCNKTFSRQSQLKSHLTSHSEVRPFECKICLLKFKYRRNLVEHSSIHDAVPSFICSVCGLTFKQKSNLLKHERTHREASKMNFRCTFCAKEYTQSSHLKTHMRNIHGDNCGYTCSECSVVVLCRSSLRRHMSTVHAKSTKFTCPHCNKGFNNYQNYQGHVRGHTGERPYCCVTCNKTFTTPKALSRHRLIHQGTKSHKCTQCSKAFLELCDLKRHVKRHLLKRVKKANKMSLAKNQENANNPTAAVDPSMNSINLMVLTESLLFTESQQILENTGSRATEVILPHEKLDVPKVVTAEPVMNPDNIIQPDGSNLPQASMDLTKGSHILRTEEEVLASSQLMPAAPDMEAVSLLANTAVLQPPEVINGITTPLDPSQVLQPTNIDVQDVVTASETSQVSLSTRETSECTSASEAPTMVMLSSVTTPSEYLPVPQQESNSGNPVIDGTRHQQSERVLSHATW